MKLTTLLYLFVGLWCCVALWLVLTRPPLTDESTHSFVGLFLRDLIRDWLTYPTLAFERVYNYSISYLTYYPKISLHYPPLVQTFFALSYFLFSPSLIASRTVIFGFALALLALVGHFTFKISRGGELSLLAMLILITSPVILHTSTQALQEIPFMFFFFLTIFLLLRALEKERMRDYALVSLGSALCILSKWQGVTVILTLLAYAWVRGRFKKVLCSLILTALLLSPYYYVMWRTDLIWVPFKANIPAEPQDPKLWEVAAWVYYPRVLITQQFFLPVGLIVATLTFLYIRERRKYWKLFLVWIASVLLTMTLVPNKDVRYTLHYLPAFVIPCACMSHLLLRKKVLLALPVLLAVQAWFASHTLPHGLTGYELASNYVVAHARGNILLATPLGVGSEFIFPIARMDKFEHRVYRSCLIHDSPEEFEEVLREYGIEFIVVGGKLRSPRLVGFKNFVSTSAKFEKIGMFGDFEVFRYEDWTQGKPCNYICATQQMVCSDMAPLQALK